MEKFYVYDPYFGTKCSKSGSTYDDAVIAAKKRMDTVRKNGVDEVLILQAIAVVKAPVPEFEVVKLT